MTGRSLAAILILCCEALAQPEVHADRSVTFRLQAPKAARVVAEGGGQGLDGDLPAQGRVPRAIHASHPARTQGFDDLVRSDMYTRF